MSFGIDSNGFNRKRLKDIKESIEEGFKSVFGDIRTDPQSGFGQMIGVLADSLSLQWELSENVYFAHYPNSAEGKNLDDVCSLSGITRLPATKSTIDLLLTGANGTAIPSAPDFTVSSSNEDIFRLVNDAVINDLLSIKGSSGSILVDVVYYEINTVTDGDVYEIWFNGQTASYTSLVGATADSIVEGLLTALELLIGLGSVVFEEITRPSESGGSKTLMIKGITSKLDLTFYSNKITAHQGFPFESIGVGEIPVFQGAFGVVETPVSGVDEDVISYESGHVGGDTETDAELRIRRNLSLQVAGGATVDAIRAGIIQNVAGVTSALVIENDEDLVVGGLPAHSVYCVVDGGDDADIGEEIFVRKSAGIQTSGGVLVVVTDSQGNTHDMLFDRPTDVPFNIAIEITKNPEEIFPTDGVNEIKNNILEYVSTLSIGDDIVFQKFFTPIYKVEGVYDADMGIVLNPNIADPNDPADKVNIPITFAQVAKLSVNDIVVTVL